MTEANQQKLLDTDVFQKPVLLNLEPDKFGLSTISYLEQNFIYLTCNGISELKTLKNEYLPRVSVMWTRLHGYLGPDILSKFPNLIYVVSATTGLNHVDTDYCKKNGIEIISLKEEYQYLNSITATAELTFGLILCLVRKITPSSLSVVNERLWRRDDFIGFQLRAKVLGLVGYGRLGRIVAGYAAAFGMRVLAVDTDITKFDGNSSVIQCSLPEVLTRSDIVSVHADFSEYNRHMIGAREFAMMQKNALFINTARGELVDESALLFSLEQNRIAGAALDVLDDETAATKRLANHPLVEYASQYSNLILTPHLGGACEDAMRETEFFIAKKLVSRWVSNEVG